MVIDGKYGARRFVCCTLGGYKSVPEFDVEVCTGCMNNAQHFFQAIGYDNAGRMGATRLRDPMHAPASKPSGRYVTSHLLERIRRLHDAVGLEDLLCCQLFRFTFFVHAHDIPWQPGGKART